MKADVSELLATFNEPVIEEEPESVVETEIVVEEVETKSDEELLESFLASPDEEEVTAKAENDNKPKNEKTPEDLLSEFEKMLG